jgi:hypothetical protein
MHAIALEAVVSTSVTGSAAIGIQRGFGRILAAIIGPGEESGPSTRMRDGPNAA